jgi:PAS domain S-box-containing protein
MSEKLRILILEDVPADAELVQRELRKAGIQFDALVVDTEATFTRALEEFRPDVILSDFNLPTFDFFSALSIAKGIYPDIPVITVTGSVGDEQAVEILKRGANDYILKDRLSRLGPSTLRALEEAREKTEHRRAEEALQRSETGLSEAQKLAHIGSAEVDLLTNTCIFSDEHFRIWGYEPGEVPPSYDFLVNSIFPDDREQFVQGLRDAIEGLGIFDAELRIVRPDGAIRHVHFRTDVYRAPGGNAVRLMGTAQDITERKQAQEALLHSRDFQAAINTLLRISLKNLPLDEILAQSLDLLLSIPWLVLDSRGGIFLVEDEPEILVLKVQKGLAKPIVESCSRIPFGTCLCGRAAAEQKIQFADHLDDRHEVTYNGISPHGHYCVPILSGGKTLGVINLYVREGHCRDMQEENFLLAAADTIAGAIQRRRAEETLQESQSSLNRAQEIAHIGSWEWDIAESRLHWSDELYRIFGIDPQTELTYDGIVARIHPDDRARNQEYINRLLAKSDENDIEFRIIRPDGSVRYIFQQAKIRRDQTGKVVSIFGIMQDITARKRAEEAILRYRWAVESSSDLISAIDKTYRYNFTNETFLRYRGFTREQVEGRTVPDVLGERLFQEVIKPQFDRCLGGEEIRFEFEDDYKVGHCILEVAYLPLRDGKGNIEGVLAVSRDITKRKQAEKNLHLRNVLLTAQQEASIDGILVVDETGHMISFNQRFLELWEIPADVAHSNSDERALSYIQNKLMNPDEFLQKVAHLYTHKDEISRDEVDLRDGRTFDRYSAPMIDPEGRYFGRIWTFRDITERKQAEKNILNLNRLYQVLSNINQTIIVTTSREDLFQKACAIAVEYGKFNFAWIGVLDEKKQNIIPVAHDGKGECHRVLAAHSIIQKPQSRGPAASAIRTKKCAVINDIPADHYMQLWGDNIRSCGSRSLAVVPLFFRKKVFGVFHVCSPEVDFFTNEEIRLLEEISSDLSFALDWIDDREKHRKAEEALRESEKRFKQVSENAGEWIWETDADGIYRFSSMAVEKILGYSPGELVGRKHFYDLFAPEVREEYTKAAISTFERKESFHNFVNPNIHKNGNTVILETSGTPILDEKGYLKGYRGVDLDITERMKAEKGLRESEGKYRELTESLPQPVFEADNSGRIIYANREAFELFGYTVKDFKKGISIFDVIIPEDVERAKANISNFDRDSGTNVREYTAMSKNGATFPASIYSTPIIQDGVVKGIRGFMIDLTERIKAEAQLRQAQKMETIGQLAGGVAHDFNNILMAIMGFGRFALRSLPENSPAEGDLNEVLKNAERAANLTKQLLAFSRKQHMEPVIVNLNEAIIEMGKLLRRLIGEHIELVILPEPGLWKIKVDPVQIEQVIINLAVNARDAMPQGGKLTISTENARIKDMAANSVVLQDGEYVKVSAADTGIGMNADIQSHIFEPFFTTKEPGKGTGLGLATSYGIVKQSGGYIFVESELGQGSIFTIYLPRVAEEIQSQKSIDQPLETSSGKETVLLAEDETSVRRMIARALSMQGYRVIEAINGEEALASVQSFGIENIHLLLTDVVMPLMGGEELAARIRELRPDIKIIFMSGYTTDSLFPFPLDEVHTQFIQKPIMPEELLVKIRHMLDESR